MAKLPVFKVRDLLPKDLCRRITNPVLLTKDVLKIAETVDINGVLYARYEVDKDVIREVLADLGLDQETDEEDEQAAPWERGADWWKS